MRILYVLHQFYPEFSAGTERVTLNLAKAAQRAGHYVRVLACIMDTSLIAAGAVPKFPELPHTVYQGVPVTFVPRDHLSLAANYAFDASPTIVERLAAWMADEHFDVCHVLHSMRMGSALAAVQRCEIPYLLTLTDFFIPCFRVNLVTAGNVLCGGPDGGERCARDCIAVPWTRESLLNRFRQARYLLAGASRLICPSEYVAERFRAVFPEREFSVLAHGVDFLGLSAGGTSPGSEEGVLVLGYIGSIVPQKGVDTLLRALARVPDPNIRLRLCGGFFGDHAYADEVRQLVEADSRVELLGQLPHPGIFELLGSLDVLCLPSRVPETFSLVLHEACVAGVPALVSALGAPGVFVDQHGCGRAITADDIGAWADAISDLVVHRENLGIWRDRLPLPLRVEEEAFFYDLLYRQIKERVHSSV